ncbi:sodium/potassium-transporting ATPase subunit beta-1-like [Dysidea avara]|uniref:sodium/potassium-transporting ATPase subunit beta-1-like n=1 Tax=Dysidea avara TaxID=196820 RepID=UPI00331BBC68
MPSLSLPTREQITRYLRKKSREKYRAFIHFAYNKEKSEYFGRTPRSWGQIGLFYLIFYGVVGGFFAVHLALFTCHVPDPNAGESPRNFGEYAYPNYPNSQISLLVVPRSISYNGQRAFMGGGDSGRYNSLLESAREVGVDPVCTNETNGYGYTIRQPCVFLHVSRVYQWSPEAIDPVYASRSYFDIQCNTAELDMLNISVRVSPSSGIPLNYTNSTSRRFPFSNQENYITPLISVMFDFTNLTLPSGAVTSSISCGLNISSIPTLPQTFGADIISELVAVPKPAVLTMSLSN